MMMMNVRTTLVLEDAEESRDSFDARRRASPTEDRSAAAIANLGWFRQERDVRIDDEDLVGFCSPREHGSRHARHVAARTVLYAYGKWTWPLIYRAGHPRTRTCCPTGFGRPDTALGSSRRYR